MGKQKKTICPGIETCIGPMIQLEDISEKQREKLEDVYNTICNVPGNCGYCGHFVSRKLMKKHHKILGAHKKVIYGKHKWVFSDLGKAYDSSKLNNLEEVA